MADRVIFVCTLVLAGVYFYATEQLPSLEIGDPLGPKAFPRLLGIGLVITAVVLLLEILRARKSTAPKAETRDDAATRGTSLIVGAVALWTLLYFIAFERLGYILSTSLYLLMLTSYFNRGKTIANVLTSVLFPVISYLMFTKLLGVTLPPGILPF
jgi:putative tricarboxylic transport membrane protein